MKISYDKIDIIFRNCWLLTHWGRVTHICVSKLTITSPDNDLSPGRRQAIIWTNAGILFIRTLGTNFSESFININTFWLKKVHFKMSSGRWQPSYIGLNVLNWCPSEYIRFELHCCFRRPRRWRNAIMCGDAHASYYSGSWLTLVIDHLFTAEHTWCNVKFLSTGHFEIHLDDI